MAVADAIFEAKSINGDTGAFDLPYACFEPLSKQAVLSVSKALGVEDKTAPHMPDQGQPLDGESKLRIWEILRKTASEILQAVNAPDESQH